MFEMKRFKCWLYLTGTIFLAGVLYVGYFCPARLCALGDGLVGPTGGQTPTPDHQNRTASVWWSSAADRNTSVVSRVGGRCNETITGDQLDRYLRGQILHPNLTSEGLVDGYQFDMDGDRDVLVFLHMQKTGGTTFGHHLVKNMRLRRPCVCYKHRKRCDCQNAHDHMWLFSRYSTGWRCGLHADWTELTSCVDESLNKLEDGTRYRRFLYITILREPFNRYISEYKHVHRGATWMAARLECNGRQASLEEVPFCFEDDDWSGVTLDEFMSCPHNLANNRQTRMLANLSLSDCYGESSMSRDQRDCIMLNSAKQNLAQMAFFGLTEYQHETQYLFEKTFGLKFNEDFFQYNHTHASDVVVSSTQRERILKLNRLDVELYEFAKKLFFLRLEETRRRDAAVRNSTMRKSKGSRPRFSEDYEEGDENFAEDDLHTNYRLMKVSKSRAISTS